MSEDVEEASKQQMTSRSGRSFGVGPVGDSGDLLSVSVTRPSTSAAHSASFPLVEIEEIQLGSEAELIATTRFNCSNADGFACRFPSLISNYRKWNLT